MDNRLIFLYHSRSVRSDGGTQRGRPSVAEPSKPVGRHLRQIRGGVDREVMVSRAYGRDKWVEPAAATKSL